MHRAHIRYEGGKKIPEKGLILCLIVQEKSGSLVSRSTHQAVGGIAIAYRVRHGDVAQMGERYVRNVQVRGSIPLISTIFWVQRFTAHGSGLLYRCSWNSPLYVVMR
jgi:hypothetical protein